MPMRIDILTIFPEMFGPVLSTSIPGRAQQAGLVQVNTVNIRDFTTNKHLKVDDRPFGGGPGMVMGCQPIWDAVKSTEAIDAATPATRILMTPEGIPLHDTLVGRLALEPRLLIIAGRYEGVDERVIEALDPIRISTADVVLSGGEIPAMLLIDAVIRRLPDALGHEASAEEDSFAMTDADGCPLVDCPHYTRPREWAGRQAPEILMSGDHQEVERWRMEQRIARTREFRPDLLDRDAIDRRHRMPRQLNND
ncbi:MAG: tRNA (guanosine(37)-N1)-methyltransferase TrmD [Planctomycetota bacterium]